MLDCKQSDCTFVRRFPASDFAKTNSLREALSWNKAGYDVEFYYKDAFAGMLAYAGHLAKAEYLPEDGEYGVVYLVGEESEAYINIPDVEPELCCGDSACDSCPESCDFDDDPDEDFDDPDEDES